MRSSIGAFTYVRFVRAHPFSGRKVGIPESENSKSEDARQVKGYAVRRLTRFPRLSD